MMKKEMIIGACYPCVINHMIDISDKMDGWDRCIFINEFHEKMHDSQEKYYDNYKLIRFYVAFCDSYENGYDICDNVPNKHSNSKVYEIECYEDCNLNEILSVGVSKTLTTYNIGCYSGHDFFVDVVEYSNVMEFWLYSSNISYVKTMSYKVEISENETFNKTDCVQHHLSEIDSCEMSQFIVNYMM